ncbi:hypothetical protein [Luteipulveratus flavus]|uniref:Uncharacterized protein n=1 Tax=Luteipulveratus flavus TaxID=3031728 RepID=A0ABT6C2N5_9MICO|nr:hypothetical protein [Luteipulveratus sp. YIM 133296]MDF8263208.1 hypothetical protein [Luteipulveratus sp. YIM 133296]
MLQDLIADWTRQPTAKEREQLQRRLARLQVSGLEAHLNALDTKLLSYERSVGKLRTEGLRLRRPFVHLSDPIDGDSSDRKAPPRELRPPATRISSSLGSTLRLELTVLALLQLHRKPKARAHLADLEIPIAGDSQHTGWADLVAALPTDNNVGGIYHNARDKRARTVRKALERLATVGLVDLPGKPGARNRFEGFVPLYEAGAEAHGEREEYAIPETSAAVFALPPGFILNGWLHVLEDSEIAVLLMAACGAGSWIEEGLHAFPGKVRLRHYGIHRDPYSAARKTLDWFGLLDVREIGRHSDGRAEDDERYVHRIGVRQAGFEERALPAMRTAIQRQLDR